MATSGDSKKQDDAAGGRERRLIRPPGAETPFSASIEIKQGRYAYLRWATGGNEYVGALSAERDDHLRQGFEMARKKFPNLFTHP